MFNHDEVGCEFGLVFVFQVKDLTKFLDPSGLGVISFEDFHRGISAITNGGVCVCVCARKCSIDYI